MPTLPTEVQSDGYVAREIGLDSAGRVTHRKPSLHHRYGDYGHFDSPPLRLEEDIAKGFAVLVARDEFERTWLLDDLTQ
jgi:hypothetical protein